MRHDDPEGPEDNPILVWLFKHGWEDPDWGQSPVGQVVTAAVIYQLANRIGDAEVRSVLTGSAAKIITNAAAEM